MRADDDHADAGSGVNPWAVAGYLAALALLVVAAVLWWPS